MGILGGTNRTKFHEVNTRHLRVKWVFVTVCCLIIQIEKLPSFVHLWNIKLFNLIAKSATLFICALHCHAHVLVLCQHVSPIN